jgi:hypothetical protein
MRSCLAFGCAPLAIARATDVCRRSWHRRSGRLIFSRAFFHLCDVKLDRWGGFPRVLTNTRPFGPGLGSLGKLSFEHLAEKSREVDGPLAGGRLGLSEPLESASDLELIVARNDALEDDPDSGAAIEGRLKKLTGVDHNRGEWVMGRRKSGQQPVVPFDLGPGQCPGGPRRSTSYGKRVARRKIYRTTNGINRRVLKDLGL